MSGVRRPIRGASCEGDEAMKQGARDLDRPDDFDRRPHELEPPVRWRG
jgi:hypothetical protein